MDVLQIEQVMGEGWILLRDVDLPGLIERVAATGQVVDHEPVYGAKHVFDFWPYQKIQAGNIGAIRLPPDRSLLAGMVEKLRTRPAEVSPGSCTKRWRVIDDLLKKPKRKGWFFRSP